MIICICHYISRLVCDKYDMISWYLCTIWYCEYLFTQNRMMGGFLMMTSSNANIYCVTGPLCGEFTGQRSFDVFDDLRLNKRLSKQSRRWWFETSPRSLWRHCNMCTHITCLTNTECIVTDYMLRCCCEDTIPLLTILQKYLLRSLNHMHIWQVSLQLSCGKTCQIWT